MENPNHHEDVSLHLLKEELSLLFLFKEWFVILMNYFFQHDGTCPYSTNNVLSILNDHFHDKVISNPYPSYEI
jgi:hypothetical protein